MKSKEVKLIRNTSYWGRVEEMEQWSSKSTNFQLYDESLRANNNTLDFKTAKKVDLKCSYKKEMLIL